MELVAMASEPPLPLMLVAPPTASAGLRLRFTRRQPNFGLAMGSFAKRKNLTALLISAAIALLAGIAHAEEAVSKN